MRSSPVLYRELGLSKVLRWVKLGLLDASEVITMKVCGGTGEGTGGRSAVSSNTMKVFGWTVDRDRGQVCNTEQHHIEGV